MMFRLGQHRGTYKSRLGGVMSIIAGLCVLAMVHQGAIDVIYNKLPYVRITLGLVDE